MNNIKDINWRIEAAVLRSSTDMYKHYKVRLALTGKIINVETKYFFEKAYLNFEDYIEFVGKNEGIVYKPPFLRRDIIAIPVFDSSNSYFKGEIINQISPTIKRISPTLII